MTAAEIRTAQPQRRISGLPAEVTSFVGRRHEMAEVKRLLSGSHLVTLTGMGGVGKTRLALHVAVDVRRAFPGGVWLVELADLEDAELVPQAVANAIGVQDRSGRPIMDVLVEHLAQRHALLVVDNCEHMLPACAVLVNTLVRALPELRILATSRQAIGIAGEQTVEVPPLSLPGSARLPWSTESFTESEAVRLFAERAANVLRGFEITEGNREAVAAICRTLDGLPLAIELAAVRLRALSAEQLLHRLEDRFRLLTAGPLVAPPRQRTLRALVDWSYDLCTPRERLMWQRISVFAGSLDLEAAEAVCAMDGIARADVLDLITGLVEKSVLIREERSGTVRYRLLDTIRQYGREKLAASGREEMLRRRHRDHYRRLAARAWADRFDRAHVDWLARLQPEQANIRAALEWSFGSPHEAGVGLGMAVDLTYHWIIGPLLGEGRHWLHQGLIADTEPSETRARALGVAGWFAVIQADIDAATVLLEEAQVVAQRLGLKSALALVTLTCGMVAMFNGELDAAIGFYQEAVDGYRAIGDPVGMSLALTRLSLAHSFRNEGALAMSFAQESVALSEAHHEVWHGSYAAMALGIAAWRQGDHRRAAALAKDGLRFHRTINDLLGIGMDMELLAWVAAGEGRFERAAFLVGALDAIWRAVGAPLSGFGHLISYYDECRTRTAAAMGEPAFHTVVQRAAKRPLGEMVAYALREEAPAQAQAGTPEVASRLAPLTRRETEIARLVAQGLSNKDIAATLVISQRTAEGHVEHILDKLGFKSRAQIAAWLSERTRDGAS